MGTHYKGTVEEERALDVYLKVSRAAESVANRINRNLATVNLTISQFGVLEALYHLGSMHQVDLAGKILKSTGNMTLVIDNLVKRGLVERRRDENDRRYITVHLTPAGLALIENYFPSHVQAIVDELQVLTAEEQEQFASLCKKLGHGKQDEA